MVLVVIDYFSVKTRSLAVHQTGVFYGCDIQGVPMYFLALFFLSRDVMCYHGNCVGFLVNLIHFMVVFSSLPNMVVFYGHDVLRIAMHFLRLVDFY